MATMDILTGQGLRSFTKRDISGDPSKPAPLGRADKGDRFGLDAFLGATDSAGNWDSSDRLKFSVPNPVTFDLVSTTQNTIIELVRFSTDGSASVVASTEYGSGCSVQLDRGRYGLNFFVEGDLVGYQAIGQFT